MPTILLTYEFGSGFGHLNRLIAIGRRLAPRFRVVFALPDPKLGAPVIERALGRNAELRAGVTWQAPSDPAVQRAPTHSFADVLQLFGYADPALLKKMVDRWRSILQEIQPDLIVADFAPTLRLAVTDATPIVVVGNGYTVPPPGRPLSPMRSWETILPDASRRAEAELLETANAVRNNIGGEKIVHLADLFSGDETFVCTLPEFDPYSPHREAPTVWPFNVPVIAAGPTTTRRTGPAVFVYMPASHPLLDMVLNALNELCYPSHLYISNADPTSLAKRCGRHIGVLTRPADFSELLPQVRLLIHHAGLGTAYAGMAAGTPQLVLPLNLEHLITARGLVAAGIAHGFSANSSLKHADIRAAVASLLEEPVWMDRAAQRAAALSAQRDLDPLHSIVASCNRQIAAGHAGSFPSIRTELTD